MKNEKQSHSKKKHNFLILRCNLEMYEKTWIFDKDPYWGKGAPNYEK